ncbi:hypothetical protein CKO35_08795 [Ectothiorhodospira shaposhnikovii]|uniref:DUF2249 domain-containing protein n=1 Tax=Ectothiorhodospira shaposhnikovii TaxID=1054 RepID=UPI001907519F|nr:hypothetical protein [Ectothiorhodospira shaposhnikovii]
MNSPRPLHVLDVRDLPPPEPMEQVLERLPGLTPGEILCMRHRREPFPLYPILRDMGFQWQVRTPVHVPFEILIWRAGEPAPEDPA